MLTWAIANHNNQVAEYIVQQICQIDQDENLKYNNLKDVLTPDGEDGYGPLIQATTTGNTELAKFFIDQASKIDNYGTTLRTMLMQHDDEGDNVLLWAITENNIELTKFIINKVVAISPSGVILYDVLTQLNDEKRSALNYAVDKMDLVKFILNGPINVITDQSTKHSLIQAMLTSQNIDRQNLLVLAIKNEDIKFVKSLIQTAFEASNNNHKAFQVMFSQADDGGFNVLMYMLTSDQDEYHKLAAEVIKHAAELNDNGVTLGNMLISIIHEATNNVWYNDNEEQIKSTIGFMIQQVAAIQDNGYEILQSMLTQQNEYGKVLLAAQQLRTKFLGYKR